VKHPAKFGPKILAAIDDLLGDSFYVLDPFAGTGRIHELGIFGRPDKVPRMTVGIEIEPEWADMHPQTRVGDATFMPQFGAGTFDAIATSPAYGNRMADSYDGRDGSKRNTYRTALGRELDPASGAGLQWGEDYRTLHDLAWKESVRVLKQGGRFVLNMKDHIRDGERVHVTDWHVANLVGVHGLTVIEARGIYTTGNGFGANGKVRIPYEEVILFSKGVLNATQN
jgi:tRNA G10  N-methylase Trm11